MRLPPNWSSCVIFAGLLAEEAAACWGFIAQLLIVTGLTPALGFAEIRAERPQYDGRSFLKFWPLWAQIAVEFSHC